LADLGYQARGATPHLLQALQSRDVQLRWRAARALGLVGDDKAAEGLRKQVSDADALVRAQSLYALGRLGSSDEASLAAIVGGLTDADSMVRRAAVSAFLHVKADRAQVMPLIVKTLEDGDPAVVLPALHTLADAGADVVPALAKALEHKEARYWACLILAELGPKAKEAVPALQSVLADERPEVRLQALIALGEIGSDARPAMASVAKAMEDPELSVRYGAAFALGRIGDSSATPALEKAVETKDPFLQQLVIWALAKVDPQNADKMSRAIKTLVTGLLHEKQSHRSAAARGLMDLGQDELVSKEIDALMPRLDEEQFERYVTAFASLGPRVVPRATEVLADPKRRERGMRILARVGPDAASAVPDLVKLLADPDARTRTSALYTLAAIGPKAEPAVGPISQALADRDRDVKLTAAYALARIGPPAKGAAPTIARWTASDDPLTKLTAVTTLLRIEPQNAEYVALAVPTLIDALQDGHEFVRVEAAMTLGELGDAAGSALPALEAARRNRSSAVRAAANEAVKKIQG
jgi:HEAT repeat protein